MSIKDLIAAGCWMALAASAGASCRTGERPEVGPGTESIADQRQYDAIPIIALEWLRDVCPEVERHCAIGPTPDGDLSPAGGVLAWDLQGPVLVVPPPSGPPHSVGAKGAGPGEFQSIMSARFNETAGIELFDPLQQRLLRYDSAGGSLLTARAPMPSGFISARLTSSGLLALAADPRSGGRSGDSATVGIYRIEPDAARPVKVADLPLRQPAYGLSDMRPQPRMFEARALWQIAQDGAVIFAAGSTFLIDRYSPAGVYLRRFGFDLPVRQVEESEVAREQERRMRGIRRMPALHPASHHPAITRLRQLDNGQLWVRESPDAAGDFVSWVVFGPEDLPLGRLQLPAETDILAGRDSTILVHEPTDRGIHIARLRLPRP